MDEKALIILIKMLDKARIQANSIKATENTQGVYGHIAQAIHDTFLVLTEDTSKAAYAYQALSDGCTVEEALEFAK